MQRGQTDSQPSKKPFKNKYRHILGKKNFQFNRKDYRMELQLLKF